MARSFTPQLLAATLLATASFGTDFWPLEYSFEETYVGEASVSRGLHRVEDFDESDTLLRFVFTPRVKLGVLRLGFEYEQFSLGWKQRRESTARRSGRGRTFSICPSRSAAPIFIVPISSLSSALALMWN